MRALVLHVLFLVLLPGFASAGPPREAESILIQGAPHGCELHGLADRNAWGEGFTLRAEGTCIGLVEPRCPVICGRPIPFDVCRFGPVGEDRFEGRCDSGRAFSMTLEAPAPLPDAADPRVIALEYGAASGPGVACFQSRIAHWTRGACT